MAISDAKRAGNAAHLTKLKEQGWKKVTVWLSPEAQETVSKLKAEHGSFNAGLEVMAGAKKG